jgi:hypothetical protein
VLLLLLLQVAPAAPIAPRSRKYGDDKYEDKYEDKYGEEEVRGSSEADSSATQLYYLDHAPNGQVPNFQTEGSSGPRRAVSAGLKR